MSAQELKDCVRQYAQENLPGWECAGVVIRVGRGPDAEAERLVVLPTSDEPVSPVAASLREFESIRCG
jgi:hypothetical protein